LDDFSDMIFDWLIFPDIYFVVFNCWIFPSFISNSQLWLYGISLTLLCQFFTWLIFLTQLMNTYILHYILSSQPQ